MRTTKSCDFDILFERTFIKEMQESTLEEQVKQRLKELGTTAIKQSGIRWPDPYTHYKDTALVTGFYLGNNGTWLAISGDGPTPAETQALGVPEEFVIYTSHNIDNPREAYGILSLVSIWTDLADAIKRK